MKVENRFWKILTVAGAVCAVLCGVNVARAQYGYAFTLYTQDQHFDNCYWTGGVYDHTEYTYDEYGNIIGETSILTPYSQVCNPYDILYVTVELVAADLNPACTYNISWDGGSTLVTGQSSWSTLQTYDTDNGSVPEWVNVTQVSCPPPPQIHISGPSTATVGQTVSYTARIDNDPGNLDITWSGGNGSASGTSYSVSFASGGNTTVTASITGSSDSITVSVADVTGVQAVDSTHPGRIAGDGSTLYLVNENSAQISALGGSFPSGFPSWSGGQSGQSFTDASSFTTTYSARGHSVTVNRTSGSKTNLGFGGVGPDPFSLTGKLPGGFKGSVKVVLGQLAYTSQPVELFNNPGTGTKRQFACTATVSGDATQDLPKPYSFDAYGWAGYAVYFGFTGSVSANGGITYDPSAAPDPIMGTYQGGLTGSGSLTIVGGVRAYIDAGVRGTGEATVSTQASANIRTNIYSQSAGVQGQLQWNPLNLNYNIKITDASNPSNVYFTTSGNWQLVNSLQTPWVPLFGI